MVSRNGEGHDPQGGEVKTPEQMAEEYANSTDSCDVDQEYAFAYKGFLAGYQAAKEEYKVAIDVYNNVAKQMLNEAVRIMSLEEMKDE